MNVLLSGSTGFLGANILKHFVAMGHHVDTIGRSNENVIVANLANFDTPINTHYDLVIHAAGKAHVIPKNLAEEKMFYDVNLEGTKNLLKSLIKPPSKFIFISTVAVYGRDYGLDINEDHPLNANTPYGKSKVLAEKEIQDWSQKYNIEATILRLPLIIGNNPKGNLQSMINAIRKGFYFNIGKGDSKKSMVLVDDVSLSILTLMNYPNIYHLTDGYNPSFKELSNLIGKHFGVKRILSLNYYLIKPIAIFGDIIKSITSISLPLDSKKLEKINKSLTFNDSRARAVGYVPRQVLESKNIWLK
tara:strand:+ start:218 stop:1126 length:909 start_codon:yes stop_codon:yes gene_type:complete